MMNTPRLLLAAATALWLASPAQVAAQSGLPGGFPGGPPGGVPGAAPEATPRAQPQAAPRPAPRSPRTGTPTQQLFDAINEGVFDDVRAAVAAGADIGARNVLGLTPVDLAVDLGLNDIALYLVALGRVPERSIGTIAPPPPQTTRRPQPVAPRGTAPPPTQRGIVAVAPLWRGDGGAPNPEIGFLGFDAGRPAGASAPASQRAAPQQRPSQARPAQRTPVSREALPPG